jgi:chromosome segregation ATPase
VSVERPTHAQPPRQPQRLQDDARLEPKEPIEDAEEWDERLDALLSDANMARQKAEARADTLQRELEKVISDMASLREDLAGANAQLEERERERELLTKELDEARSQLKQLTEAVSEDELKRLHDQEELLESLVDLQSRLQAAETGLTEEIFAGETRHQAHQQTRLMLIACIIAALGAGLFFGRLFPR